MIVIPVADTQGLIGHSTNYYLDSLDVISGTAPLHIGGKGSDWMQGAIDEVRVERVSRSEAWIKLNYETQREDQITVFFN